MIWQNISVFSPYSLIVSISGSSVEIFCLFFFNFNDYYLTVLFLLHYFSFSLISLIFSYCICFLLVQWTYAFLYLFEDTQHIHFKLIFILLDYFFILSDWIHLVDVIPTLVFIMNFEILIYRFIFSETLSCCAVCLRMSVTQWYCT